MKRIVLFAGLAFLTGVVAGSTCEDNDTDENCSSYTSAGYCTNTDNMEALDYVKHNCQKSCGLCDDSSVVTCPETYPFVYSYHGDADACCQTTPDYDDNGIGKGCPGSAIPCPGPKCKDAQGNTDFALVDFAKHLFSFCSPSSPMSSTNLEDAKKECTGNPSCTMFYSWCQINQYFSCTSSSEMIQTFCTSIVYKKHECQPSECQCSCQPSK